MIANAYQHFTHIDLIESDWQELYELFSRDYHDWLEYELQASEPLAAAN